MVERRNISCAINAQTRLIYTLRNITSRAEFMKNRYLCKAKRTDYGEWIYEYLIYDVADSLYRVVTEREYSTGTSMLAIAPRASCAICYIYIAC